MKYEPLTDTQKEKNAGLTHRSGQIKINSRLVSFLYDLMRDHLSVGTVEELVREAEDEPDVNYSNGWLASYAKDLANRLDGKYDGRDKDK